MQEIFIELWRTAARFDPPLSSESTYVTMIAKRRLIDRFRRRRSRPEASSLSNETGIEVAAPEQTDRVEQHEEAARVRQQMQLLRHEERMVLELSFEQGHVAKRNRRGNQNPAGNRQDARPARAEPPPRIARPEFGR